MTKQPQQEDINKDKTSSKKKAKKEQKKSRVTNDDQHPDFTMTDEESWQSTFCWKCVSDCPNSKDGTKVRMCPSFLIKKYCFEG
eukprot:15198960-Ditylum_brightwellii.AAC.1